MLIAQWTCLRPVERLFRFEHQDQGEGRSELKSTHKRN